MTITVTENVTVTKEAQVIMRSKTGMYIGLGEWVAVNGINEEILVIRVKG